MIIAMQTHGRLQHLAAGILKLGEYTDREGQVQHEDEIITLETPRYVSQADLHLFWGYRAFLDAKMPEGKPCVVADKGFVRRPSVMLGFGQDWGALATWPKLPDRKIDVPEWQWTKSRTALLLGQDPKDFSAKQDCDGFKKWQFQMTELLQAQGWEVRHREHPRNLLFAPKDVARPPPLADDLLDVGLVVGLNTGALVECFWLGYPVHAAGAHSFVQPFSVDLKDPDQAEPEGRQAFFEWMAGQCWTYGELADGRAWEAVRDQMLNPPAKVEGVAEKPRGRGRRGQADE